jgi:phospholipase A1
VLLTLRAHHLLSRWHLFSLRSSLSLRRQRPARLAAGNEEDKRPTGCRDRGHSEFSRFWELQRGNDCHTFSLRGYRPISLAIVTSNNVSRQPSSPASGHTTTSALPYQLTESKSRVSARTKIAKGLLKAGATDDEDLDSAWFRYTQQSY